MNQEGIMNKPVKLGEIIDAMDSQSDETTAYLNKETGELVLLSEEEFSAAEEKLALEAERILEDDEGRYIALPSKFDIDEYRMMERFALSVDDKFSAELLVAVKGKGAFRRFKDRVAGLGIEKDWYKFRDEKFKELAIEWCEANKVEYLDDL
jgi:hypothetical protein